jgi:hypothetical protein
MIDGYCYGGDASDKRRKRLGKISLDSLADRRPKTCGASDRCEYRPVTRAIGRCAAGRKIRLFSEDPDNSTQRLSEQEKSPATREAGLKRSLGAPKRCALRHRLNVLKPELVPAATAIARRYLGRMRLPVLVRTALDLGETVGARENLPLPIELSGPRPSIGSTLLGGPRLVPAGYSKNIDPPTSFRVVEAIAG